MPLCADSFTPEVLYQVMGILFATTDIPSRTCDEAKTLFSFVEESVHEHRKRLPVFDEWGIVPAGHRGPRTNPWAAELEHMDESPEPDEGEDSGEDEASRGAGPSRGSACSPKSVPPEVDLQVISSGDDGDVFHVAPPRRAADEEEESSSKGGRCEPRSKAIHDRRAAVARGAPREEVGAPQEEAKASSPQPPKEKKRVWRMADE